MAQAVRTEGGINDSLTKKDVGDSKETLPDDKDTDRLKKSNDYDEKEETVTMSASKATMNTSNSNDKSSEEKQSATDNIWDGQYSTGPDAGEFSSLGINAGKLSIAGEEIKEFEWNKKSNELKWNKQKIKGKDTNGTITFTLRNDLKLAVNGEINSAKISGISAKVTNNALLERAKRYSPLFRFHADEKYFPISIGQYGRLYAKFGADGGMKEAKTPYDEHAPIYVFHSQNGDKSIITYALLYSYNLWTTNINLTFGKGNHAADIEYLSLVFINGKLKEYYASAHSAKDKSSLPIDQTTRVIKTDPTVEALKKVPLLGDIANAVTDATNVTSDEVYGPIGFFEKTHAIMDITEGSHGINEGTNKNHRNWPTWAVASFKFYSKDNPVNLTEGEYDVIAKNGNFGKQGGFLSKWVAGTLGSG
eukprot:351992_1